MTVKECLEVNEFEDESSWIVLEDFTILFSDGKCWYETSLPVMSDDSEWWRDDVMYADIRDYMECKVISLSSYKYLTDGTVPTVHLSSLKH